MLLRLIYELTVADKTNYLLKLGIMGCVQ